MEAKPEDPSESTQVEERASHAQAQDRLNKLMEENPTLLAKIQRDFEIHYIRNFTTRYNRERLGKLQEALRQQQKQMEKDLETLKLEQEALALYVQTKCIGEPEKDKICPIL